MDRVALPLTEIHPKNKNWTALVQVVEKQRTATSKSRNPKRYQKLIFTDVEGNKVQAMIYAGDIQFFRQYFELYKRYYISNAKVQFALPQYRSYEGECTWTIDNSTLVETVNEEVPPILPPIFTFTPFMKIYDFIDSTTQIDVLRIAAHVFPKKGGGENNSNASRQIVLIDQSCMPVIVTLWDEYEVHEGNTIAEIIHTKPLIAALRVKATSYGTMTMSTKFGASILINPPIHQAAELRTWSTQEANKIQQLISEKAYANRKLLLPLPDHTDIKNVEQLFILTEKKAMWIQGTPKLLDRSQRFWYHACPACFKSLCSVTGWTVQCTSCKKIIKVEPRCRMTIELRDHTAAAKIELYGEDIEQLLPFTAAQLKDQDLSLQGHLNKYMRQFQLFIQLMLTLTKKQTKNLKKTTQLHRIILSYQRHLDKLIKLNTKRMKIIY